MWCLKHRRDETTAVVAVGYHTCGRKSSGEVEEKSKNSRPRITLFPTLSDNMIYAITGSNGFLAAHRTHLAHAYAPAHRARHAPSPFAHHRLVAPTDLPAVRAPCRLFACLRPLSLSQ